MDIAIISRTKLEEEENKDQLGDLEHFYQKDKVIEFKSQEKEFTETSLMEVSREIRIFH